jgi:hypothetical protein
MTTFCQFGYLDANNRILRLDRRIDMGMLIPHLPRKYAMNITAKAHDFELSEAIAGFARDQLSAALNRFSDGIIFVDVYMKDTNGPRGGADKQVLIRVRLRNLRESDSFSAVPDS